MAGYKEIVEDREFIVTKEKQEGTKSFYKQAAGTSDLPALDDPWSTAYKNCILRKIKYTPFFPDPANRALWIDKLFCIFSSSADSGNDNNSQSYDPDGRKFNLGAEVMGVESPTGWTWEDTGSVAQPLFKSNIMGTFTIQRLLTSDSAKNTWIAQRLLTHAGTINDRTFEGWTIGSVLFSGLSGGTQYDENGDRTWLFDLEFTYRIIRDEASAIVGDDWLYIWRKDNGTGEPKWDKPKDVNNKYLYEKTDLSMLLK